MDQKNAKTMIHFIMPILVVPFWKYFTTKCTMNSAKTLQCIYRTNICDGDGGKAQNFHTLQQVVLYFTSTLIVTLYFE